MNESFSVVEHSRELAVEDPGKAMREVGGLDPGPDRPRRSPFRSLEFFTDADAAVFAGREEEIEEVATRILAGDTLVVYGPSGVGKTSLLCAGVVPALRDRRGYRATYVRPLRSPRDDIWRAVGADPDEPLAAALARLPEPPPPATDDGMQPTPVGGRTPHVLVLDQIEELFTRFDEAQRKPLWDGLVEVIEDSRAAVRLVLALREEYLHFLDAAHPRLSNLLDRRFRLRGLTPFGARTAIVRPLVASHVLYAPELIDRCVADLTEVPPGHPDEDGVVDPMLLQIVCSETYERAEKRDPERPSLTLADYLEVGGASGVFRRHLDELFKRVRADDHLALALVLQEMTTAHATKRPATVSRLSHSGLLATPAEIQDLLDKLVLARLVREYRAFPEPWYELVHDRLVTTLPELFARDQRFLQIRFMREIVRQLSKGFSEGVAKATLLSEQQLADLVEPFRTYIRFNEVELDLLFRSAVATEHGVTAWHHAYETAVPGGTPAVLLDMFHREDTRRAGARAAGVLRVSDPAVRSACMDLALADGDARVEEAAAGAVAVIGDEQEVARMRIALADSSSRPRALRVLGELERNAAFRVKIAKPDLRRARRLHDRTRLHAAKDTIDRAGREGQLEGLWSGGFTGVIAALFMYIVWEWLGETPGMLYGVGAIFMLAGCTVFGALCGRAAGRAMARSRALDKVTSWMRVSRQGGPLITILAFPIASVWLFFTLFVEAGAIPALLTGAAAIVAIPIALLSIGVMNYVQTGSAWYRAVTRVRILYGAIPIPWLFAIGIGYMLWKLADTSSYLFPDRALLIVSLYIGGALCSVASAAMASALAEAARELPHPPAAARANAQRALGSAPAAVLMVVVALVLREAPPPFLSPIYEVTDEPETQATEDPFHTSESWTGGRWLRIRNESSEPRIVFFKTRYSKGENEFVVWPGTHTKWYRNADLPMHSRQPYRRIFWQQAPPRANTYTVIELEQASDNERAPFWKVPDPGLPDKYITSRLITCRVVWTDLNVGCGFDYFLRDCGLNPVGEGMDSADGLTCSFRRVSEPLKAIAVQGVYVFETTPPPSTRSETR